MSESPQTCRRLFDWWSAPSASDHETILHEEFQFDSGVPGFEDFVWWVRQKPDWKAVSLLKIG
ncbi:MAG: hypothetical protein AAFQ82_18920, partial [Myxococcota bacterium]